MTQEQPATADVLAGQRTDLSVERTVMAASRTLMAWVRTGTSLISFGFAIYKFLQETSLVMKDALGKTTGPRHLGLFLIALGTISVILGSIEYFKSVKRLNKISCILGGCSNTTLLIDKVVVSEFFLNEK